MRRYNLLWVTIIVILLDQATKLRVRYFMEIGDSIPVLGNFFRLTYITNPGAAFGMSFGSESFSRVFFIFTTSIAILLFLYLLSKDNRKIVRFSYALILGGAAGNLIDRIAYGSVIDFFDFKFFYFIMERWPVFNIADSVIVIAVFLLIIDLFLPSKEALNSNQDLNFKTIEESL